MKHASPEALETLSDLLSAVRTRGLTERRPGIFYHRGKAWLHFHEDKADLFADIRSGKDWERLRVSDVRERAELLSLIDRSL